MVTLQPSTNHYKWMVWEDGRVDEAILWGNSVYHVINAKVQPLDVKGNRMGGRWEAEKECFDRFMFTWGCEFVD